MKRLLLALSLICPAWALAEPHHGASHIWETAIYGDIPGISYVKLEGWNAAITTTFETAWPESTLHVPATAVLSTPYCASTSANDTAAGTGARTLTVTGVTHTTAAPFVAFTETVTLNGQTSVNLTTANVLGINSIAVATAGSGGLNAGVIDCGTGANTAGSAAVVYGLIPVSSTSAIPAAGAGGGMKSNGFVYTVPTGYTLVCRNIQAGSVFATAASGFAIVIDTYTNLGLMKHAYGPVMVHNTGANPANDLGFLKFPAKTQINGKLVGMTGTLTGPAHLSAECLLISDAWKDTAQSLF